MLNLQQLSYPNLNPKTLEIDFLRERFYESLSLLGFKAQIYIVESQELEFNSDVANITYKEPIQTYVHLEEFPKRTILSSMGWFNENTQQQPIAYLPTFYYNGINGEKKNFYPERNTKLVLEYDTLVSEHSTRTFLVSDIQADGPYVINWITLLVPQREELALPPYVAPLDPSIGSDSGDLRPTTDDNTQDVEDNDFFYIRNPQTDRRV